METVFNTLRVRLFFMKTFVKFPIAGGTTIAGTSQEKSLSCGSGS